MGFRWMWLKCQLRCGRAHGSSQFVVQQRGSSWSEVKGMSLWGIGICNMKRILKSALRYLAIFPKITVWGDNFSNSADLIVLEFGSGRIEWNIKRDIQKIITNFAQNWEPSRLISQSIFKGSNSLQYLSGAIFFCVYGWIFWSYENDSVFC